jgi:hypothetical protein
MLELVAAALEDGWALVRKDEQLMLLRPPYRQSNVAYVSEDTVDKAVELHGFQSIRRSYDEWENLIGYLRHELTKAHRARFGAISDAELQQELLRDAPRSVLEEYLRRTELELLPNREWRAAVDLLTVMTKVELVQKDHELLSRSLTLLNMCFAEMSRTETERADMAAEGVVRRFPLVAARYSVQPVVAFVRHVAETHQVFVVGAA